MFLLKVILFFGLVQQGVLAEARLEFSELMSIIEKKKAARAKAVLKGEKLEAFHIDRLARHFQLSEDDQIFHLIYIMSNNEVIDGELAFQVARMFAYKSIDEGTYSRELAEQRLLKIRGIGVGSVKDALRHMGGDYSFFEKNLQQLKRDLLAK